MVELNIDVVRRAIGLVEEIHKDLDFLEVNLRYLLGSPVCVSGCGDCCSQSFMVPQISAQYIASNIKMLPETKQQALTKRLERWMTYQVPDVRLRFSEDGDSEKALRNQDYLMTSRLWCPFLDEQKSCLIYPWRDVNCRAWGVSRPPGKICRRPLGSGETDGTRLYIGSSDERVREVQFKIAMVVGLLQTHAPSLFHKGWLPALVYAFLEPEKWAEMQPTMQQIKKTGFNTDYTWLLTLEDVTLHANKEEVPLEQTIKI